MPPRSAFVETAGSASRTGSIDCGGVFSRDSSRETAVSSAAKVFIICAFVCALAAFAMTRSAASLQGTDFPDFYCAARMLAAGHGPQLYDADLQRQYQARYAGRVGTLYIHPPFEAATLSRRSVAAFALCLPAVVFAEPDISRGWSAPPGQRNAALGLAFIAGGLVHLRSAFALFSAGSGFIYSCCCW